MTSGLGRTTTGYEASEGEAPMSGYERRHASQVESVPRAAPGIALSTWLWVLACGLVFWLAVARSVLWIV